METRGISRICVTYGDFYTIHVQSVCFFTSIQDFTNLRHSNWDWVREYENLNVNVLKSTHYFIKFFVHVTVFNRNLVI